MSGGFIAIDWGSTNFRAFRVGEDGSVRDKHAEPLGIADLSKQQMGDVIESLVRRWPAESDALYCCGMIGSTIGWEEVPYLSCPIKPDQLVRHSPVLTIRNNRVRISPGLACKSVFGPPDVMRGEELQYLGALTLVPRLQTGHGLLCMPGTHTKWVAVDRGVLLHFSTSMVGDIFNALRKNSLLKHHLTADSTASPAFEEGVEYGRSGGGLSRMLFSVRSRSVTRELPNANAASYASGIMIGNDVADALDAYREYANDVPIVLIGNPSLCTLYQTALRVCRHDAVVLDAEDACILGFQSVRAISVDPK